jgi:hypothetical protein
MPDYDKKPTSSDTKSSDKPNDPPSLYGGDDLGPPNSIPIPKTDFTLSPRFSPNMDDPDPRSPSRQPDSRVPGGDPPAPGPWGDMFNPPKLAPVPENRFTPEEQKAIKDKRKAEETEHRAKLRKELGLDGAPEKPQKGDYELPPDDPRVS